MVHVRKHSDPQAAKDVAGAKPDAFSWGSFDFETANPQMRATITAALGL